MKNLMPIFLFLFSSSLGAQNSDIEIYSEELHFTKHTEKLKDEFYKYEIYYKAKIENDYVFITDNFNSGNFHIQKAFFGYYFITLKTQDACYRYKVTIEPDSEGHGIAFSEMNCETSIADVNEKEKLRLAKIKM